MKNRKIMPLSKRSDSKRSATAKAETLARKNRRREKYTVS